MGMWSVGLGAIGAAVTGIVLANTDLFLSKPEKATLEFLEEIELKTLGSGEILAISDHILQELHFYKKLSKARVENSFLSLSKLSVLDIQYLW